MASRKLEQIIGQRVLAGDLAPNRRRYPWHSLCLAGAAILMVASIFLPYWSLDLAAPQYPKGLRIHAYVDRVEGDVVEIDAWNHYIGLPSPLRNSDTSNSLTEKPSFSMSFLVLG